MGRPRVTRPCKIENCNGKAKSRGLCVKHYSRWQRHGDPLYEKRVRHDKPKAPRLCSVPDCTDKHWGRGYCMKHLERVKKYGDPHQTHQWTRKICLVADCTQRGVQQGYCKKHSWRLVKNGDPLKLHPKYGQGETPEERFWSRVDKSEGHGPNGDCWEWQGHRSKGYGGITVEGRRWKTHQYAYYLTTGCTPTLDILHSCDNPPCCNPAHLREGTHAQNMAEAAERGRMTRGETRPNAKLTESQVLYLRATAQQGASVPVLANELGIALATARNIINGNSWKYLL